MPTRVKILSFWLTFSVFGVEKGCNVTTFSSLLMSFGWLWAFWEFNFCCQRNKGGFYTFSHLGSVWIGLILLKLKTYCWNHCSKIIFKCVNSTVGPIFNEKIDKKWNLWVHEQYTNALFTGKSQHLRLLFMHCSLNNSRIPPKTREKKKKKERNEWKRNFT